MLFLLFSLSSATIVVIPVFTASLFYAALELTPFLSADREASLLILLKPANAAVKTGTTFFQGAMERKKRFLFSKKKRKRCKGCTELCTGTEL